MTHKPATALPWSVCEDTRYLAIFQDGKTVCVSEFAQDTNCETNPDDVWYMVRAANAYPRLVGALIEARNVLRANSLELPEFSALLRELGEDA